jgi:hypothetical protein
VPDDFSAREVSLQVIGHLERRRPQIAFDGALVRAAVDEALAVVEKQYLEAELPPRYLQALAEEVRRTVPERWQPLARDFVTRERKGFGIWRGGDPVARATYLLVGLVIGGLIVWAPFIPIWEKWFPFVLAVAAFFLPDLQTTWHRRRYARALGDIAVAMERIQPQLDEHFTAGLLSSAPVSGTAPAPDAPDDPR